MGSNCHGNSFPNVTDRNQLTLYHIFRSLAYGNFSGLSLSLVIGAPGYGTPGNSQHGRVYLVTNNAESGLPSRNLNLDSDADMIVNGTVENGRFGTAVAVVDLNQDGLDDLAVSAPSTGGFKVPLTQLQNSSVLATATLQNSTTDLRILSHNFPMGPSK